MAEDHPEDLPETSTEPASEHEAAVAAAVPLDDLMLRIIDEQTALADQLHTVLDGQRLLGHDVTMTLALAQTLANGQTAILDEMRTIRGQLAQLGSRDAEACANNCGISGRSRTVSTAGCALARTGWRASRRRRRRAESPLPDLLTGHAAG